MKSRCTWCEGNDLYMRYHDEEWGVPVRDDIRQFEFLVLESAQAGLSWLTILKKREQYRLAYDGFDPRTVMLYEEEKVAELLANPGIVRNRKKIEASINNAQAFVRIQEEFGSFCSYLWKFVNGKPIRNAWKDVAEIPARTDLSDAVSLDMKKRGFRFLGSTIMYSHLQAVGLVNDHLASCFRYKACK